MMINNATVSVIELELLLLLVLILINQKDSCKKLSTFSSATTLAVAITLGVRHTEPSSKYVTTCNKLNKFPNSDFSYY